MTKIGMDPGSGGPLPAPRPFAWVAAILIVLATSAFAPADPIPPSPTRWVTDGAALLSAGARVALDARLEAYERTSGHQMLVWIAASSGGLPVEDFAVRAFEAWRVGRQGLDDGLALFIFADDHRSRIEVGYGLEGVVTDLQAARILRDVLAPRLRSGDADVAVVAAVDELVGLMGGEAAVGSSAVPAAESPAPRGLSIVEMVFLGMLALALLALLVTHPQMALFLLASIASGGAGGRGGSGGSGRRGGGGRSGGGGATGSW